MSDKTFRSIGHTFAVLAVILLLGTVAYQGWRLQTKGGACAVLQRVAAREGLR